MRHLAKKAKSRSSSKVALRIVSSLSPETNTLFLSTSGIPAWYVFFCFWFKTHQTRTYHRCAPQETSAGCLMAWRDGRRHLRTPRQTRPRINGSPQQRGRSMPTTPMPERHRGTRPDPNFKARLARRKATRSKNRAELSRLTGAKAARAVRAGQEFNAHAINTSRATRRQHGPRYTVKDTVIALTAATPPTPGARRRRSPAGPQPPQADEARPARPPARRAARGRRLGARGTVWRCGTSGCAGSSPSSRCDGQSLYPALPGRSGAARSSAARDGRTDPLLRSAPRLAAGVRTRRRYPGNDARRRCVRSEVTGRG